MSVPVQEMGYYDWNMNYVVEPGEFRFYMGGNSRDCRMVSVNYTG